ncbi:MAG: hypothetical protein J7K72_02315 [Candidatus Aenigmarchaeota archaeon]|nr:hypothetical protein [Candidatus Aenigmarchaeota archaeon]
MKIFRKSDKINEFKEDEKIIKQKISPSQESASPQPIQRKAASSGGAVYKISRPTSPPLFIKIDRYNEVIKNLRNLRNRALNLKDALDILEEIHKEIENAIDVAQKTLDEVHMLITNLDSFFLRPQAAETPIDEEYAPEGPSELDNYVKDVYSQLEKLKAQLRAIR